MCCLNIVGLAMLIGGIIALIKGEVAFTKTRKVTGTRARIIGGIMLLPLPLLLMVGFIYGIMLVASGETEIDENSPILISIQIVPIVGCALVAVFLGMKWSE